VLKRMRWRFIASAMAAVVCVMTILVVVINTVNSYIIVKQTDSLLTAITKMDEKDQSPIGIYGISVLPPLWGSSRKSTYTTVYFRVDCDKEGNIQRVSNQYFTFISNDEAESYANLVMKSGKSRGFYKGFRWLIKETDSGNGIFFLNVSDQMRMVTVFLYLSILVEMIVLLVAFILIWIFSKKAVNPFIKNIERQKQFITDAGHEIKTPLTSIVTSADILAMDYQDNEWVNNIQNQASRLTKLVGDLVTLSRLDEAAPFPDKTDFQLSDAVWEAIEPFISLSKAKGKRFTQEIEDGLVFHGDKVSIQQLITILLDNAIKYSDKNGEIHLYVYKKHKRFVIETVNTCNLTDTKDLGRLFERFYRMDRSRSAYTGGTGIGLSIAEGIAEAHNGKITAESKDGKTIRFRTIMQR